MKDLTEKKGPIAWFANNHVAANLLMFMLMVGGLITIFTIKVEFFPEMSLDFITVTVPYRGASPAEVEQGVCLRVEEAVSGVDGIKRLNSTAAEGAGMMTIEVEEYADAADVLDDVKAEVDRIITFPVETEKPIISEVNTRYEVLSIVLHGNASERSLKELADNVRNELTALDDISYVEVAGVRPYEISIEVSEETLRRYSMTFDDISSAIKRSSLDVPGGSVKTVGGEVLIRTKGQKYTGSEFENIIVLTRNDGTIIRLRDIATVIDEFDDSEISSRFDSSPAVQIKVYRVGEQGALKVAKTVKDYVKRKESSMPNGILIDIWQDTSIILKARMDLLMRNARMGLILVFLSLSLFLNPKLAFWTTMGIPISFLGAFWLLPLFDVSLNMISLFGFIMALGIVVDDAIVVGENIYAYREKGYSPVDAAIKGVREMAAPVTMAVLTTIFAFAPLLYISGIMGKIMRVIPLVVISVLAVSLVEALLILPAHLSPKKKILKKDRPHPIAKFHGLIGKLLAWFVNKPFAAFAMLAVRWRYVTLAIGISVLLITVGLIKGGRIKFVFMHSVEADNMVASLTMPQGTPIDKTLEVVEKMEAAAELVQLEYDEQRTDLPSIYKHMATTIGAQPASGGGGPVRAISSGSSSAHLAEINIELLEGEERDISSGKIMARWRELVGDVPGVSKLTFQSEIFSPGDAVSVELSHEDFDTLIVAAEDLKSRLRLYSGTSDIADNFEPGKAEIKLALKDAGRTLGLTLADLANQARQGFYGQEVQRIQRGRHDVRVMVRYPQDQRKSIAHIENMKIRLPSGAQIPFQTVADVTYGRGYATIRRAERMRIVTVTADVDDSAKDSPKASEINAELQSKVLPDMMMQYPGLQWRYAGEARERNDSMSSMIKTFPLALLAIYGLLAVQFRSYFQPIIVMSAIPFGVVGATFGHVVMGFDLGLLSMFGIIALSGIVVNDSLIMIDLINRERAAGIDLHDVVRDSVTRRFRPIMLTTLTTFLGLAPMMMEKSLQARFLIPMAISLAFGVAFATMITLILVPSLYMILEDFWACLRFLTGKDEKNEKNEPVAVPKTESIYF